jgi:hypothetical protein
VAVNKEQVAPKVVQTQRESDFRGSQQAQRESQVVQRKSTFRFRWERGVFQDCQEGVMG